MDTIMTSKLRPVIRRKDGNQDIIVAALRKVGASVVITHTLGHGMVDIIAAFMGVNYLIEIKQPGETLTPDEQAFFEAWHGQKAIAYSPEEAIKIVRG